jgi:3-oxoacyl-[acyl-carrier-protein] synthase-1
LGNNVEENLCALRANRSGIAPLRYLKTSHTEFPVGEVKMTDEEMIKKLKVPENKPTTRTSLMGMLAVSEALVSANLRYATSDVRKNQSQVANLKSQIAFISGTTVGGMDKSEQFYLEFFENDTKNAYISTHDCGACTEMIADHFGIFSQVDTISTACSSAANAIVLGAELLKSGRADIVVAGGSECLTKFHLNGFNSLMILDRKPCRPFDATRAGINLGEGAAYIVMETAEHFKTRRHCGLDPQYPVMVLSGAANTCDAYHQTASSPDGEGAYLAMKKALENAQLKPEQIDYINAHGTGTDNNDLREGTAIVRLFGEKIPPVSSTKSFTGHTTSAAGCVETVISILALQHNFIPVNLNFSEKMPDLSFAPATNQQPIKPLKHVLCDSFGFGGNDTSLIFSKL